MIKATVLYGNPAEPETFEKYYDNEHAEVVGNVTGISKAEYIKFLPNTDGSPPAYYSMAE